MSNLELIGSGGSPFDAIRRTREDGTEYWSARDLMPLMDYPKWQQFEPVIERACKAAENQGLDASALFRVITKKTGGRPQADFELTRFAAYLVAMNGDPRKSAVAAAQAYFAIRTREAETAPATPALPQNYAEALQEAANQYERAEIERQRAETEHQRAEHLDGWKRAVEGGDGISPTDFGKKYFSEVPAMQFQEHLYSHGWQIKQIGTRIDRNGKRKNGYDHGKPTAKGRPYIYGHDNGVRGGRRRFTPRIRPQRELELRDRLIAEGLPANEHSTGLIPLPHPKEIVNA